MTPTNLYKPYKRMFEGPAEAETVFETMFEAEEYAKSIPAYDGQIIFVSNETEISMFVIKKDKLIRVPLQIEMENDKSVVSEVYFKDNKFIISNKVNISPRETNILALGEDGLYVSKHNVSSDPNPSNPPTPPPQSPPSSESGVKKFTKTIGDGLNREITVVHGLDTLDVVINVWNSEPPREYVVCDIIILDKNTIQVIFQQTPTLNQFRVVVVG